MNTYETLKGTISITRTQGGDDTTPVRIVIRDENSGGEIIDVRMGLEDFSDALFGRAYRSCNYEIHSAPEIWGMNREIKSEKIPKSISPIYDKEEQRKYLSEQVIPYEIDGWKASVSSALSTRQENPKYFNVPFYRYVDGD